MDHITHNGGLAPAMPTSAPAPTMQVRQETGVRIIEEDFLPPTAGLAGVVEQAEARQDVLTTAQELAGQQTLVSQVTSTSATPAHKQRRSSGGKKVKAAAAAVTATSPSAPDSSLDSRSVNIILPTSTYEWFEKQAREADYEPSLAKYLQWQLRKLEKGQRAQERAQEETKIVTEASLTASSGEPLPSLDWANKI